jgi:hypothetical protein
MIGCLPDSGWLAKIEVSESIVAALAFSNGRTNENFHKFTPLKA